MLKFICNAEEVVAISATLINGLVDIMTNNEITTLAGDYYDDDLGEELSELIEETDDGFTFDEDDQLGEESYGCVSMFFESCLDLLKDIKAQFPNVGITGIIFVNDIGITECVMRQGVLALPESSDINFIDQLQCAHCGKIVDTDKAYKLIYDEEQAITEEGEILLANAYSNSDEQATFCFCCQECADNHNFNSKEE